MKFLVDNALSPMMAGGLRQFCKKCAIVPITEKIVDADQEHGELIDDADILISYVVSNNDLRCSKVL